MREGDKYAHEARAGFLRLHRARVRQLLFGSKSSFFVQRIAPFSNLATLGSLSAVCRRWNVALRNRELIERCIEAGGASENERFLAWLELAGMAVHKGHDRRVGLLSVLEPSHSPPPSNIYNAGGDISLGASPGPASAAASAEAAVPSSSPNACTTPSSSPLGSLGGTRRHHIRMRSLTKAALSDPASQPPLGDARMSWGKRIWMNLPSSMQSPGKKMESGLGSNPSFDGGGYDCSRGDFNAAALNVRDLGGGDGDEVEDDSAVWDDTVEGVSFARVPGLFAALLVSAEATDSHDMGGRKGPKRSSLLDIEKDVERTANFEHTDALRSVLRCLSIFMPPSVGYVQGMNFLCRFVLDRSLRSGGELNSRDEKIENAFWLTVGLMSRFGMLRLYSPGMPLLRLRFYQLDKLIMWHMPLLFQHLHDNEVVADLYATSWFITILADGSLLEDEQLARLWDRLFLAVRRGIDEQTSIVFRVILELLKRAESNLLKLDQLDEIVHAMTRVPRTMVGFGGVTELLISAKKNFEHSMDMPTQLSILEDQYCSSLQSPQRRRFA